MNKFEKSGILQQSYFNQLNPNFFQSQLNARLGLDPHAAAKGFPPKPSVDQSAAQGVKHETEETKKQSEQSGNDDEGPDNPTVELENFQLWSDFHQFGTEMVITKTGR